MIFQNTWGAFQDPEVFKDPEVYRPESFIENPDLNRFAEYAFGTGRVSTTSFDVSNNENAELHLAACLRWHPPREKFNCMNYCHLTSAKYANSFYRLSVL
jgi:hypothetical protein